MSYILDALRRADAERQQGAVPGLHAAPTPGAAPAARGAWRWWAVVAVAGGVGLAAAWAWFWRAPAPPPAVAPQLSAVPAVPVPMPASASASASASAPGLPVVVSAAPSPPLPEAARPAPPGAPASAAAARPVPQSLPPNLPLSLPLSSLPPEERRQMPPLVPGGSVWSDSAASRFVILDGQVLREGDAVAPGLVLERIERKAAVLRWKNQRVELPL